MKPLLKHTQLTGWQGDSADEGACHQDQGTEFKTQDPTLPGCPLIAPSECFSPSHKCKQNSPKQQNHTQSKGNNTKCSLLFETGSLCSPGLW